MEHEGGDINTEDVCDDFLSDLFKAIKDRAVLLSAEIARYVPVRHKRLQHLLIAQQCDRDGGGE